MSSETVSEALRAHFASVCCAELTRMHRKLSTLSESDRAVVAAVVVSVIGALADVPAEHLDDETKPETLHALVRLFDLQPHA